MRTWGAVVGLVVVVFASGCLEADSIVCASGRTCPVGSVCDDENDRCVTDDQLAACQGKTDGEDCEVAGAPGICDRDLCILIVCGNGVVEPGEVCDTKIHDMCRDDCLSTLTCGNGIADFSQGEECDCGSETAAEGCSETNSDESGFCRTNCQLHCGDGEVRGAELCDGGVPAGVGCFDFGFDAGRLSCHDAGCVFDFSSCSQQGWQKVGSANVAIQAISGRAHDDVFAVGEAGAVFHWDGGTWTTMVTGTLAGLHGVWVSPNSPDVFAVGDTGEIGDQPDEGIILHYDGTTWEQTTIDTVENLTAVSGSGPNDVVAVGPDGVIFHFEGTTWTPVASLPEWSSSRLTDVHTLGPGSHIIVDDTPDDGAAMAHLDGDEISEIVIPGFTGQLQAVAGSSTEDLIAVGTKDGQSGLIYRFNGDEWQELTVAETEFSSGPFYDVAIKEADNMFAVGGSTSNRAMHYDGASWTELMPDQQVFYSVWGIDDVWFAAGDAGVFRFSGQAWTPPTEVAVGEASERLLETVVTLGPTDAVASAGVSNIDQAWTSHFDGQSWTNFNTNVTGEVTELWGTGPDDIHGLINDNVLIRFNGASWSTVSAGDFSDLRDLWGVGDEAFAVGLGGTIAHFSAGTWQAMDSGVTSDLYAVWGRGPDDVFAVGGDLTEDGLESIVLHFDGDDWSEINAPAGVVMFGLSSYEGQLVGVGVDAMFLGKSAVFDGTDWTFVETGTNAFLLAADSGDLGLFASGSPNMLLHFDGEAWAPVRISNNNERLTAVAVRQSDVLVSDGDGLVHRLLFIE